ncbi:DUF424 domain-containing protein [Acidianus manzaensis]|uniref:DUF424 domain-containing protein n=1 Tax=Acidianus manzaensis TaxID=282676 RepID=A0A1W6JXZ0_9CREN|nr:DUF424 family protein [Acidianus manzaensis]ARM75138.1 hypothetical protein B6F84_03215 [Acidianus manzaensis]
MNVILNIIRENQYTFVNLCEKELLGKEFKDDKAILSINKEFYGGEEVDLEYAFTLFNEATVVSIVGNNIVDEAIKRGYVHKNSVLEVKGVKFAQVYNL